MLTGWRYRIAGFTGTVALVIGAVLLANHPVAQSLFTTHVPLFNRLEPTVLEGTSLRWALLLSVAFVGGALLPLYKPQPRRFLDTVFLAQKRVVVGGLALATLGFFKWSHRLPRQTLVMTIGILAVVIPLWFVWMRHRPAGEPGRTLLVGDDLEQIGRIAPTINAPVIGYLCPTRIVHHQGKASARIDDVLTDGGTVSDSRLAEIEATIDQYGRLGAMTRLGGLSRLEDVLLEHDVDTVVLAFAQPDRAEFFGALDACHEHGVSAKVHREYADSVLVSEGDVGELVDVDLEPWDPFDHVFKRVFDVAFATVGLIVFTPLLVLIAAAIKLDSRGPVFYNQDRTAGFGETFSVYKFRSMLPESEDVNPGEDDSRVTRVGCFLRKTHLDELPQLWSIFVGDMSVVGPRAAWTEEERLLEQDVSSWRKRWFVKPGLTGLAQINDAKSTDPDLKLRYDLEYIRKQSVWFDMKIVIRQIWKVLEDVVETVRG
ncbi:sugar transferase [Natrialbaceae archaeon A-CW1-1]